MFHVMNIAVCNKQITEKNKRNRKLIVESSKRDLTTDPHADVSAECGKGVKRRLN